MPVESTRPSAFLSTIAVLAATIVWGWLKLGIFADDLFPLTFVLPLLLCVWTRRVWHMWFMALSFLAMASWQMIGHRYAPEQERWTQTLVYTASVINICIGSAVIAGVLQLLKRLDMRHRQVVDQNAELEAQAEELARQNEEIREQSEEIAQQTEEIGAQAEELTKQNEDLVYTNSVLNGREEVLQAILHSSRTDGDFSNALAEVCHRTLRSLGEPAASIAVMEVAGESFQLIACHPVLEGSPEWPCGLELARLVIREGRTAYVEDFSAPEQSDSGADSTFCRSALMTPYHTDGGPAGVLAVIASVPSHWSGEQFRLLEWSAAQCGLLLEASRAREALQERSAALESANLAKDHFLASLSHELRTPLTPVMAVVGLLENDARLPGDVVSDIRMIQRNIGVQSRLIDDLLDLTRIARGKIDLNRQLVCVLSLLRECAGILQSTLQAGGLTLEIKANVPDAAQVHGDGARLQQVFWNILNNSIKFSPPGSVITVSIEVPPAQPEVMKLTFSDHGPGIAVEDVDRIFQPFEQAATLRNRPSHQGLGLGLSIARAITELHDGQIQAWPAGPEGGGRFTVTLPIAAAGLLDAAKVPEDHITNRASPPLRILLVEDHEDTGRTLSRLLARRGYQTTHVMSCAEALRQFKTQPFDILLSDLGLPDGTGIDLMNQLRSIRRDLPGICMSGYGMESDIARTREAGFHQHLIKPVRAQNIEDAIRALIQSGQTGTIKRPTA